MARPTDGVQAGLLSPIPYAPGGSLFWLEPAAPAGTLRDLFSAAHVDVRGLAVSPDGLEALAGLRTGEGDRSHLAAIDLARVNAGEPCLADPSLSDLGPACRALTFGPADDTDPFYLPDGRIAFLRSDPDGPVDFQGRMRSRVLFAIEPDGTGLERLEFGPGLLLGPRLSGDGWVRAALWTEQGGGAFRPVRLDPTGAGDLWPDGLPVLGLGAPLEPALDERGRLVAICTSVIAPAGAGTFCRKEQDGSYEAPLALLPAGCSPQGRLRDLVPLDSKRALAAWAWTRDGCGAPSDSDLGLAPELDLALVDTQSGALAPVYGERGRDEITPRPVRARALLDPSVRPPERPSLGCVEPGLILEGFVGQALLTEGAVRLRVLEGRTGQEAPQAMDLFGEGASAICTGGSGAIDSAPIYTDGSFRVRAPAGLPIRLQVLDRYGAALANDPIWRGGPPCARRRCAGCHANDGRPVGFEASLAAAALPTALDDPPGLRRSVDFARDLQPILTRACAGQGCHDAASGSTAWVDFSGALRPVDLHAQARGLSSVAYQSLVFRDRRLSADNQVLAERWSFVVPGLARESRLMERVLAPCRFDCAGAPVWAPWGVAEGARHPENKGGTLSDAERWLLVEWIDTGAAFYGRP